MNRMEIRGFRITYINEYRTSQLCNRCLGQQQQTLEARQGGGSDEEEDERTRKLRCKSHLANSLTAGKGSFMELEETKYFPATGRTSFSTRRKRVCVYKSLLGTIRRDQDDMMLVEGTPNIDLYNDDRFKGANWRCKATPRGGGTEKCDVYELSRVVEPSGSGNREEKSFTIQARFKHHRKAALFGVKLCTNSDCCSLAHPEQPTTAAAATASSRHPRRRKHANASLAHPEQPTPTTAATASSRRRHLHRDANAACNIRDIYLFIAKYGCRPPVFSRGPRVGAMSEGR